MHLFANLIYFYFDYKFLNICNQSYERQKKKLHVMIWDWISSYFKYSYSFLILSTKMDCIIQIINNIL